MKPAGFNLGVRRYNEPAIPRVLPDTRAPPRMG